MYLEWLCKHCSHLKGDIVKVLQVLKSTIYKDILKSLERPSYQLELGFLKAEEAEEKFSEVAVENVVDQDGRNGKDIFMYFEIGRSTETDE